MPRDGSNVVKAIDLKAVAEQKRKHPIPVLPPLSGVPASFNTGSSVSDGIRVVTDEEWANLSL